MGFQCGALSLAVAKLTPLSNPETGDDNEKGAEENEWLHHPMGRCENQKCNCSPNMNALSPLWGSSSMSTSSE
jgi:hypothetical protein